MNFKAEQELMQFSSLFFENQGAILEKNERGFDAILPAELSTLLDIPEYVRILEESGIESENAYFINYGSHLLEKIVNTACRHVPILACNLEFPYIKSQGFDRLAHEQFNFHNSSGVVESSAKIRAYYIFLTCRYRAQSDEQKEGMLQLVFNHETGAFVPRFADRLSTVPKDFKTLKKPVWHDGQLEKMMEQVQIRSKKIIMKEISPFQKSMTRRFRRDVTNLEEYYEALKSEMEKSLNRPGLSNELTKDRNEKIALLPHELVRKKDDLFKKYSIRIKIEPCATMFIHTPAVKVLYRLSIGRTMKNLSLIYNPVTKSMDPLVCQGCGQSITRVHFCNNLHLLCYECGKKCPVC